jgi:hypothetical protein
VKRFEGHSRGITCIDITIDSKLLASGSRDGTARTWSLDTGELKLVAGPFDIVDCAGAVRFSHDSRKLAVHSVFGSCLEVWDIQAQKLDSKVGKPQGGLALSHVPVFWTTKDRTIVTAFCFTDSNNDCDKTIYEFDSSTLETVGTPFDAHTDNVTVLELSHDSTLLASASLDFTIKLWAFESRQLLGSFDQRATNFFILSPDSRTLAYTTHEHGPPKIYICDIPPNILARIRPAPSVCIHPCLSISHALISFTGTCKLTCW